MKKFEFQLTIEWEYETIQSFTVNKILTGKNHNSTYRRAEKWVDNCLAICGKDNRNRTWTHWELKFIKST